MATQPGNREVSSIENDCYDRCSRVGAWVILAVSTFTFLAGMAAFVILEDGSYRRYQALSLVVVSGVLYIASFLGSLVLICCQDRSVPSRRMARSTCRVESINVENDRIPNLHSIIVPGPPKHTSTESPLYENRMIEAEFERSATDEEQASPAARYIEDRRFMGRQPYEECKVTSSKYIKDHLEELQMKHLAEQSVIQTGARGRQQMTTSFMGNVPTQNKASERNIPDLVVELGRQRETLFKTCDSWKSANSLTIPQQKCVVQTNSNQDLKMRSSSTIYQQDSPVRSPSKALQTRLKNERSPHKFSDYSDATKKYRVGTSTECLSRLSKATDAAQTREASRNFLNEQVSLLNSREQINMKGGSPSLEFSRKSSDNLSVGDYRYVSNATANRSPQNESRTFDIVGIPDRSPRITRTSPSPPSIPNPNLSPIVSKKSEAAPISYNESVGDSHELSTQKWLMAFKLGTDGIPSADTTRNFGIRV